MPVVDDGIVFDRQSMQAEAIREQLDDEGLRVRILAHLGEAQIPMQLDLGLGDAIHPAPLDRRYPPLLDLPAPEIRVYPHEAVVAEEFHAVVVLGEVNSRFKDFHDLFVLARDVRFDGATLAASVRATFQRRGTPIMDERPAALESSFPADARRGDQWRSFLNRTGAERLPTEFREVGELLRRFLAPLRESAGSGDATVATLWPPRGPWTIPTAP